MLTLFFGLSGLTCIELWIKLYASSREFRVCQEFEVHELCWPQFDVLFTDNFITFCIYSVIYTSTLFKHLTYVYEAFENTYVVLNIVTSVSML